MEEKKGVIGFVGFDDVSLLLADSLVRSGYAVQAYDSQMGRPSMVDFSDRLQGTRCSSAVEAVRGAEAVVFLILHKHHIDSIFFGPDGILQDMNENTVIVLRALLLPADIQKFEKHLAEDCKINAVVDTYVSKGTSEDLSGKIMIVSSGRSDAIARAQPVLSAMCEKLIVFDGEIGAGSKVKMVNELLQAIHLVASVEAISLGVQARIHPWILYDIISNAAGNSWIFKHHVQRWLRSEHMKHHTLDPLVENLATILGLAKSLPFPLPLLGVAHQQLLGSVHNCGDDDKTPLFKVWERVLGIKIEDAANEETYKPEELLSELTAISKEVKRVGFIGLGAMGFGMAAHLLQSNFTVIGYDVYKPTLSRFVEAGGLVGNSPEEVAKDVDVLVIMVTNEAQAESVLFGDLGAVPALPAGASIILSSTVSPAYVNQLVQRLQDAEKMLKLVDAPVSGGVKRAASGSLTIMASGTDEALGHCASILSALSEKLYIIKGGCGAGR